MESTAINTVYVVMSQNLDNDYCYCLKVFASEIDAQKYKEECYKYQDEFKNVYYILEQIVY